MITINCICIMTTAAAMLAVLATWRVRASPTLAFAFARACPSGHDDGRKMRATVNPPDDGGHRGLLPLLFRLGGGLGCNEPIIRAPSWPGFLSGLPIRMAGQESDPPLEAAHPSFKEEHEVFVDLSKIFEQVGPDHLEEMKESVLRRQPGCRKLVKRAIEEACGHDDMPDTLVACEADKAEPAQPVVPDELDEVDTRRLRRFVDTFRKCGDICVAVLLRDGLKGRYPEPGDKALVDLAYAQVYGS
ncbi:hypothetical protein KJ657_00970 [Patescibacteria group bacterium]|nr:hypothetical protein [Patescibacteria group bacterium]MBU1015641.1 hypothetical protein [Patescibacteria group bacterium]MBU1684784.1 hypothetical protein [Patescibacteria group bacterium]MBU1938218.1 hypothetical protein [Patescibacteria group bacterium]